MGAAHTEHLIRWLALGVGFVLGALWAGLWGWFREWMNRDLLCGDRPMVDFHGYGRYTTGVEARRRAWGGDK